MLFRPALLGCLVAVSSLLAFAQDDTCPVPTGGDTEPIPVPATGGGSTTSNAAKTSTSTGGSTGVTSRQTMKPAVVTTVGPKVKMEGGMVGINGSPGFLNNNANRSTAAQPSAAPAKQPARPARPARRGGR